MKPHRPRLQIMRAAFAGSALRATRIAAFLSIAHAGPLLAADPCGPAEKDVCEWATSLQETFLQSIPPPETQYAQIGMAFTGVTADKNVVNFEITLKDSAADTVATGERATDTRAGLAVEMHLRARRMACSTPARDYVARGGRLRSTYRFSDGGLLTIATIADCSDGAVTWSDADTDPCAPMGIDLCAQAKRHAQAMAEAVVPADKRFLDDARKIELVDARAEGPSFLLESQYRHSRAEFEALHPTPAQREAVIDSLRRLAFQLDCDASMLPFVAYGGTVRHLYRFRNGETMADIRVAQCMPSGG